MAENEQPLPFGWIREWDSNNNHPFWVDTKATPPRAIWTHPLEDEQYLKEHPEAREKASRSSGGLKPPGYDESERPRRHSYAGESSAEKSEARGSGPASVGKAPKKGFFEKLKDKAIGTKEEREAQRQQELMWRQKREEQRQQYMLQQQQAYQQYAAQRQQQMGQYGTPMYGAPPGMPYGGGYGGGFGGRGFGGGGFGGGGYGQQRSGFGGGGMALPLVGGLAGGLLLGEMMGGDGFGGDGGDGGGDFGGGDGGGDFGGGGDF